MNSVFQCIRDAKLWAHWNHSDMYLRCLGTVPYAFSPWVSSGCILGVDAVTDWLMVGILFLSWVSFRLTMGAMIMWWLDGWSILCLLIWQAACLHSHYYVKLNKGNAEECSNYHTIVLISHTSKVMLKILQASNMWTVNIQMFKLVLEKAKEPEIKLPTPAGSSKKQESY